MTEAEQERMQEEMEALEQFAGERWEDDDVIDSARRFARTLEVWEHRRLFCLEIGFDDIESLVIADWNVDLHDVRRLTSKGCPPMLALNLID